MQQEKRVPSVWRKLISQLNPRLLILPSVLVLILTLGVTGGHASGQSTTSETVQVTTQAAYPFKGWGTSLAWWANVVGGWDSARQVNDDLFGKSDQNHPDRLGLNVIRYNIGASPVLWCQPDAPTVNCGAQPTRQQNLPVANQSLVPACRTFGDGKAVPTVVSDPGALPSLESDHNQVAVLREALSKQPRGAFALEAFANSPPWWLTVNGCSQGNGNPFDNRDNLSPDHYKDYSDYLASVLTAFREQGINFDTLDPLNEPENPWGQTFNPYTGIFCAVSCQEGMHFGPEPPLRRKPDIAPLLAQICETLSTRNISTKVSFPDAFNPNDSLALLARTSPLPNCIGQINTHMYDFAFPNRLVPYGQGISIYDPTGTSGSRKYLQAQAQALSKPVWTSEFGTGGAAADITSGLTYSSIISADLKWLRPTAWVNWQAVEASDGWGLFESPTWPKEGPLVKTKRFYALEQYSRFIRPGFQILTTNDPLDDARHERTLTMAAINNLDHPSRVVIVGTNTQSTDRYVTYDLTSLGLSISLNRATVTRYRTSATENVTPLGSAEVSGSNFSDNQPAGSITTYVVDNSPGATTPVHKD